MSEPAADVAPLQVLALALGQIGTNCYVVSRAGSTACAIVDPGDEADRVVEICEQRGLEPEGILVTHCHWDHIGAVADLADHFDIPVWMSRLEAPVLADPTGFVPAGMEIRPHKVEHLLEGGETVRVAGIDFEALLLPGHSPGTIGYLVAGVPTEGAIEADEPWVQPPVLFVGDVVFQGSVGRTDLPFADHETLLTTLRGMLERLDDGTMLLSGHGPATTLGAERATNPFVAPLARA